MTVVSVVIKAMQWYCFFFKNCVLSRSVLALVSTAGALKFLSAVGKRERGGVCKSEYGMRRSIKCLSKSAEAWFTG